MLLFFSARQAPLLTPYIHRSAYRHLLDKTDSTQSGIQLLSEKVSILLDRFPGPASNARGTVDPVSPQREDYPLVKHWTSNSWKAIRRNPSKDKGKGRERDESHDRDSEGDSYVKNNIPRNDRDDSINILFWEDKFGNVIPSSQRTMVTREMRAFWQEKHERKVSLGSLGGIGRGLRDEFRNLMEERFPWLRLCEDHWKVDQLWINHFSSWDQTRGIARNNGKPVGHKREHSIEGCEAGPSSKRLKLGGELAAHAIPRPKPTRVSIRSFLMSTQLLNATRSIHCDYNFICTNHRSITLTMTILARVPSSAQPPLSMPPLRCVFLGLSHII